MCRLMERKFFSDIFKGTDTASATGHERGAAYPLWGRSYDR